jgi:WXXGXW repeat (2 copies)
MKNLIRSGLLFALLLTGGYAANAQVAVGISIGPPPRPRVVRVLPPRPGPEYIWVDGYWYPVGRHYRWHAGYWTRSPYYGARWIGPRYEGGRYYNGYWEGDRGRFEHHHEWDRDRDHDYNRYRDHDDHDRH